MNEPLAQCHITPSEPVTVATGGSWSINITVGSQGIKRWGGVRVYIPPGWMIPQLKDPTSSGYTTYEVKSVHPVQLDPYLYSGRWIELTVLDGCLLGGDVITLTYGSPNHTGAAAESPVVPVPNSEFTVSVDADGTYNYYEVASPALEVIPGPPAAFEVLLPTVVPSKGPAPVRVMAVDARHNPVPTYSGHVTLSVIGAPGSISKTIPTQTPVTRSLIDIPPDQQHIRVKAADSNGLVGLSNPALLGNDLGGYSLLFGDPHGHSILSDGRYSPEDYYAYARDISALNFCVLTDHDSVGSNSNVPEHSKRLTPDEWEHIKAVTNSFNSPDFLTLLAFEYTQIEVEVGGHRIVYYAGDDAPYFPLWEPTSNAPTRLFARLRELEQQSLVVPHHPLHFMSREHDPELQRLFEIYSMWGSSETSDDDCAFSHPSKYQRGGMSFQEALRYGYRLGVVAGGDNHDSLPGIRQGTDIWRKGRMARVPGLTGVFVDERSRHGLFEALRQRRCFGTTGQRIILWLAVNEAVMGREINIEDRSSLRHIAVNVIGEEDIETLEVIRNGEVLVSTRGETNEAAIEHVDHDPLQHSAYYYARVTQKDGSRAWSSPVWVDVV